MLISEHDKLKNEITKLVESIGTDRASLIPILQEIQKRRFFVSEYAMQIIADLLGIHPVEVQSVASFYSFMGDQSKGRFVVRLCRTISCDMQGKDAVANQLINDLGIEFGETTEDGRFTLEYTNCTGMCDQGPALLVNDRVFTRVSPESVHEIIEACRSAFGMHAVMTEEEHLV